MRVISKGRAILPFLFIISQLFLLMNHIKFSRISFLLITIILFGLNAHSQDRKVFGRILDSKTNNALEFVTLKLADTTYGTTSDKNGSYFIRLAPGAHKLVFSYIGYFTDTTDVFIEDSDIERNIYLKPSEILTETIEVLGEDPAYDIIRKAIKYKREFKSKLNEYHYNAYTKYVFRSNQSPIAADSLTTEKYPIIAILESETEGYFEKPDKYKEIVKSKRETANVNRGFAIPYIVNFYDEDLDLGNSKITGPLADDALDYYSYKLLNITSIDSTKVYKIKVDGSGLYPLFDGDIYISDSTFALMKVDLSVNESGLPTAIDKLFFKQKFSSYSDRANNFWLPTDIQIYAEGGVAGIFEFTGDVFTIISNYELNKKTPPGIFDKFIVKVLPGAKKDSTYWNKHELAKSSAEEQKAFGLIEKKTEQNKNKVRFTFDQLKLGRNTSIYPLNFYHYNRVEGSALQFNLSSASNSRRAKFDSYIGYGFSDKKTKYEVKGGLTLGADRSTQIDASIYRRLQPLSFTMSGIYSVYNSLLGLFDKQDLFDYYYATGYNISASKFIIPQIQVSLKYNQEKQSTAFKNTDYSFRKKDQPFRDNPSINDGFQRLVGFGLLLDPNKYKFIDYGNGEIERFTETSYPDLEVGLDYSSNKLNSSYEFRKYYALLTGGNYFNRFLNVSYKAGAIYFDGNVPVQSLEAFNSNNGIFRGDFSFRTMGYREFLGDNLYYLSLENDFGNIISPKILFLKKIRLIGFFNAGRSQISTQNLAFLPVGTNLQTDKTFIEVGFGLGGILDILRLDFAWRLTNRRPGSNFNFSISLLNY